MSTYNSFPSINTGNFRITAANPYLKSVDMPSIDNHTYFKFGKAYTPAYRYNPEDSYSWQEHMFDYADPLAINSVVDAAFNSQAKRQRYGLGNNVAADIVATVPALLELTYNSSIKPYYANIKHAIDSEEYGIGEALGNAAMTAGLNTLMNIGETVDVLANPVKALVITTLTDKARLREEGKATDVLQALADSIGVGDRGRINYDYDLDPNSYADGLINVALEFVSDPFNWFSLGASSAIKSTAKEAVAGAVESAAKTVVKDVAQETAEQATKGVIKEISQETAERVAKEATGEVFDTLSKRQQSLLVNNVKRALRDGNLDEATDIISKTVKNTLNGSTTGPFNRIRAHKWAGIDKVKFSDEYVDSLINKITATTLENIDSLKTAQKIYNFSEGTQKILSKAALTTGVPGLVGSYKGIKAGMHAIEQHAAKLAKDAKLDTIEGIANAIAKAQEKFGAHADADVRKHLIDFYQSKGYSKVVANHLTKKTIAGYTTQAARASALQYRQLVTNLAVFKSKYDAAMKTLVDADMHTRVKTLQPIYEELADTVSNAEEMLTSLKKLRETNMFSDTIEDYIKVLEDVVADAKADSPYKKTLQELISEMDEVGQRVQKLMENPRAAGTVKKYKALQHFDNIDADARKEVLDALNINDYASVFANTEENIISALSEMYKRNVFTITKNVETVDVQAFIEDVLDCYAVLLDGANIPSKVKIRLRHKAISDEFKKLITEYVQFYFIKNKELCAQLNELLNRSGAKISDVLTDAKKLFQESDKLLSQKRAGILPALLKSVPPKYSAHRAAMQHALPELMSKLHDVAKTNKALAHVDLHTVTGTLLIDDIDKSLGVLKVLDELRALEKSWSVEQSIEHAKNLKLKGYDYTPISEELALPYNIRYNVQERFNNLYEMSNFKKYITADTREDVLDSIDSLTRTATNDFKFVSAEDVVKTIDLYESKAISDTFDKVYKTAKPHKDFEVPVSKLAEQMQEDIDIILRAAQEDEMFAKYLESFKYTEEMPLGPIKYMQGLKRRLENGLMDSVMLHYIDDSKKIISRIDREKLFKFGVADSTISELSDSLDTCKATMKSIYKIPSTVDMLSTDPKLKELFKFGVSDSTASELRDSLRTFRYAMRNAGHHEICSTVTEVLYGVYMLEYDITDSIYGLLPPKNINSCMVTLLDNLRTLTNDLIPYEELLLKHPNLGYGITVADVDKLLNNIETLSKTIRESARFKGEETATAVAELVYKVHELDMYATTRNAVFENGWINSYVLGSLDEIKDIIRKYDVIQRIQANADMYGKSTTKEVFTPVGALRNPTVKQYVETPEIEHSLEGVSKGFKEDIAHAAKLIGDKTRALTLARDSIDNSKKIISRINRKELLKFGVSDSTISELRASLGALKAAVEGARRHDVSSIVPKIPNTLDILSADPKLKELFKFGVSDSTASELRASLEVFKDAMENAGHHEICSTVTEVLYGVYMLEYDITDSIYSILNTKNINSRMVTLLDNLRTLTNDLIPYEELLLKHPNLGYGITVADVDKLLNNIETLSKTIRESARFKGEETATAVAELVYALHRLNSDVAFITSLKDKTRLLTREDLKGLSMLERFKGKKIEKLGELSKAFEIDKLTGKYAPKTIKTAITDIERCVQLYEARLAIEMCDAAGPTGASRLVSLKTKYGDLLRKYNVTGTEAPDYSEWGTIKQHEYLMRMCDVPDVVVSNYIKEHMLQALGVLKDTPELYTAVEECSALLQKSVDGMRSNSHLKSITKKLNDIKDIAYASELDENVCKVLEKYVDTFSKDDNIKMYFNASKDKVHNAEHMSPSTQRDLYEVSKRYYNLKPNGAVEGLVNARKEAEAGIKVYAASLSKVFTSSQIRNISDVGALVKAWANKDISNPIVELLQKYKGQITVKDSPLYHAYQTITDTLDRAVFLDEVSYKLAQIPDDALPKEIRFALVDALHSNTGSKVAAELLEDMPKFIDKLCEKARVQLLCRKSKFKYSLDAIQDTMHDMFPGNDDIVKAVQDLIDEAQKTGASAHDALFDVKVTEALMNYVDELRIPKAFADSYIPVTFDIEATGINPADGQLLQIAARCTVDGKVYEFNTLVKTDTHIAFDLEAKLTGMKTTDRDAVAKAFEQKFMAAANGNEFTGLEAFYNWLTDVQKAAGEGHNKILLCGQNIDNFDIDFIKQRIDFLTSRKANTSLTNLKNMLDNADTFDTLIAYYDRDGVPYLTNAQRDFIQQTFSEYFKKLQGADWTQRIKFGEYLDGDFISACDDFCKIIKSDEVYRYGKDLTAAGINETSELSKLVSEIRETFKGIRKNNADYSTYRAFIGEHELNIMSRLYNLEDGQLMVSPKLLRDMRSVSAFYELPEVMSETDADVLTHFVKKIKNNREYIRCSSSIRKSKNFLVQAKEVIRDLIDNKKILVPGARNTGKNTARLCYEAYNDGKDCVALLKTMTYKQGAKKALVDSLDTLLKEGKIDLDTYDIIRRNCDDVYNKTKLAQSAAPDVYLTDIRDTTEALEDLAKNPHKGLDAIITNRNLWSAGEASSKALLRSTCDNFKTIAKILEPMDVKEAAAITESIKNAGALFTAHQLQDLVNKTADDLLKELHLSAGVKVVHTDYKAISNEVLDAWRANGILCEEVVNDMGSTSAYTYWIVADKSKYDYAKLVELGEDTTINPVFIEDITGNAEIDKLLVDNRNILAKYSPTLGATDGSCITDAIYSRVYEACPEALKENLLTVEELHNVEFFDKNYCNHMVIGDAASHKKYNLLYTDDVTVSHRFNIQNAVAQQETIIKYTECFMNSDMSLRTGALFKDLPAKTKLEIIRNSEGCKVAFLAPNKHAKYGYEIRTMDVYNLKTLKLAEDVDAVILPQTTIITMQRVVNKYEMPAIMKILTIPAMIYKCGYLGSLGFLFRNLTGGLINNTITAGSPLELPHTVNHWFNTVKLYREYTIVCNKITALGADAADVLHKLSDYGTVKRVITELAQNGEIKMLDPAAFMDVHKFIRHGPSAGLCKSVQDTLAAFIEAEGGKQYDSVLNKAINKTAEATGNLPILKQINTANGWIEQTLRLSLYLQEVERGSSISQAIAKVIKTHFDYSTKPLYMHYAELVVPFLSFTMNNLEFYADTFNRFGWFTGTVADAFKPTWDFDTLSDPNHKDYYSYDRGFDWGDLVSTRNRLPHGKISMARLYHVLTGNIIIPTEKDVDYYNGYTEEVERRKLSLIFKLNPSFMDAFNFLCDPISSVTDRILPYYTWGPEIALKLLNEEASVSDVALGTIAENLPIIGSVLQRTGFGKDFIGKGAESKNIIDKVKDSSNPLLAISSMFGTMYEKPAVTYSNSNRWGGVKKYNRARYFKLTQPGTTKQGSHRSAHPSNYRKGIYDMSSKSELDKRMYITSNPNIRYRIRDYYRRYI